MNLARCAIIFISVFLVACAQPKANFQADHDTPKDQLSVIQVTDKAVEIINVDGKKTVDGFAKFLLHDGQWAGEVVLDPGEHSFFLRFKTNYSQSQYTYNLKTAPGVTSRAIRVISYRPISGETNTVIPH